jgi:hypothetical protein
VPDGFKPESDRLARIMTEKALKASPPAATPKAEDPPAAEAPPAASAAPPAGRPHTKK